MRRSRLIADALVNRKPFDESLHFSCRIPLDVLWQSRVEQLRPRAGEARAPAHVGLAPGYRPEIHVRQAELSVPFPRPPDSITESAHKSVSRLDEQDGDFRVR
ncbi:hypothetical protein GCM10009763_16200 [Dermacoccus profundi]|uniref:Uncharacterized protein n=1 Tax=Dermacoccus profundi TaxID=322602 RepID=A0ABN2D1W1_9MICO